MTDVDPRRYLLPEAESKRIFAEKIIPKELARGVPQEQPVVVFVAGQPGAGKTKTTDAIKRRLDQRGGAIVVNSDFYKPHHPEYSRLLAEDDRTAAPYTSMDGRRWMALAEQYLIDNRVDALVETTMRDPGDFAEPAAMFRAAGYQVEVAILAVPEALSRLGIVQRYHDQVQQLGHGRLTARSNHDAAYQGVQLAAADIDQHRLVDEVKVYRRGNHLLYSNTLDAGVWREPPATATAIKTERHRPWDPQETQAFAAAVEKLSAEMGPEWRAELQDITRLAEPVAHREVSLPRLALPASSAARAFPAATRDALASSSRAEHAVQSPVPPPTPSKIRDSTAPGR